MGFNTFEEAAFESGIVKTMLTITQDTRTGQWPALSGYFALQLMWHLTKTGTSHERRALIKELMDHNALEIILDVCVFFFSLDGRVFLDHSLLHSFMVENRKSSVG